MEEIKKLKCELCGKECFLLVEIKVASDTWIPDKGICCQCFKNGDIEEKIFYKHRGFIETQIEVANERKEYWEKELKNVEKIK